MTSQRTQIPLSDFSKGAVIPKYLIVEMKRPVRSMLALLFLFELLWFSAWLFAAIRLDRWWLGVPILFPVFFRKRMIRAFVPWKEVGLMTLKDEEIIVVLHGRRTAVRWADQRMIRIWTVVTDTAGSNSRLPQYALIVGVQFEKGVEYLVRNEMHLTAEDKLQFMAPPPSFGSLVFQACHTHRIKTVTKKGTRWSDWLGRR